MLFLIIATIAINFGVSLLLRSVIAIIVFASILYTILRVYRKQISTYIVNRRAI